VEEKRFRSDLLYRIRGVEVTLPPLRECSDFPLIVRMLLKTLAPGCAVSEEAIELLKATAMARQLPRTEAFAG